MTKFECSEWVERNERNEWVEVDRRLAAIAKQRAGLDAEEARWLREAVRLKIWRAVGCASLLDYLERRLGYAPRTAQDRVRVAMALAELPVLEAALANGMPYTAVREITRIATRETEQDWVDACRGASVREVEAVVAGHRKGSRPSDPAQFDLATRPVTFEDVLPSTIALLRQARQKAQSERGEHLSDNDLLALVFGAFIEGNAPTDETRIGRARFQIAMVLCEQCDQGWQEGAGRRFAMEKAEVERARCDAQYIGSLDGDPERATQDVPPRVRRFVFRRDGGSCRVPGCRSAAHLEVHHIEARADGGNHEPSNLILLCDGCHTALHRGHLEIRGTAENLVAKRRHSFEEAFGAHVGASEPGTFTAPESGTFTANGQPAHAMGTSEPSGMPDGLGNPHQATVRSTNGGPDTRLSPSPSACASDSCASSATKPTTRAHVDARSRFEHVAIRTQTLDALVAMGFKRHEARAAVDAADDHLAGANTTLESFLRLALSNAPRPRMG